ncbi:MAG TPA: type VI secretion system baseplate subunit TssK [Pyrinomonadaceae bacterium]|nr:type VI secretion system baseplate subunit TssK [Pyrinomonadaceae bacterium]
MKADEIPNTIDWHDGLLLTPQHFQQISLRQEALLQYNIAMIAPFYWGIRYLRIEEPNLFRGLVQIKHVEAVMPDGLVVSYREGDDLQADHGLQLDLTGYEETKRKRMKVYLVVAPQSRQMSKGEHARYDFYDGDPVADAYTGEGKVRMRRLIPHLRLIVADAPPQETVSFPLMEVEYKHNSYAQTDYIPPLLIVTSDQRAGAHSQLGLDCGRIAKTVREKVQELASQAEAHTPGSPLRLDLETKSWIRSLAASLPQLEAILGTEVSHPFPIYLALCSMAGHLAALGPQLVPDKPTYRHYDLRATFDPVIKFIEEAIQEGLTSSFSSHLFTFHDDVYDLKFEHDWMNRRLAISMRGQPGVSPDDLIQWGRECLIGSRRHMQSMREKRILGAQRDHIKRYGDLVPPRDVALFSLHADPEFIEPDEILQIFNRSTHRNGMRPVEIVLHVKKETAVKR